MSNSSTAFMLSERDQTLIFLSLTFYYHLLSKHSAGEDFSDSFEFIYTTDDCMKLMSRFGTEVSR